MKVAVFVVGDKSIGNVSNATSHVYILVFTIYGSLVVNHFSVTLPTKLT